VRITESARRVFAADFSIPALAKEELYGGKLVAALDLFYILPRLNRTGPRRYSSRGLIPF